MGIHKPRTILPVILLFFSSLINSFLLGLLRSDNNYCIVIFLCALSILFCTFIVFKKKEYIYGYQYSKKETVIALITEAFVFIDFYFSYTNTPSSLVKRIVDSFSSVIQIDKYTFFAVIGLVACGIGFYSARIFSIFSAKALDRLIYIVKRYRIQFALLSLVYLIAFLSIMRANFNYIDDLGRTIDGHEITGDFSRYMANILSETLHINSWLSDISPLPQIIALLIMSLSGIMILHLLSDVLSITPNRLSFIALIPVGLSPYFLTCLSYKFDSPYMALSVFVSVFPLVFYKSSTIKFGAAVFVGSLIMCTTYQVSSGILPMIAAFMALIMWTNKYQPKFIGKFIITAAISYSAALLSFRLFLMRPIGEGSYVDTGMSINNLLPNLKRYFNLFINDFPLIWKLFIVTIVIFFFVSVIKNTKQNRLLTIILSTALSIILFALSFGVYLLFNKPIEGPRAFYGIGIFISLLSLPLIFADEKQFVKMPVYCLSWIFVVYAFIYGNALNLQQEYVNFRIEQVIDDLNDTGLLSQNKVLKFTIKGDSGYQKGVKNMIKEYPLLKRQIYGMFSGEPTWVWGQYQFGNYYGLNAESVDPSSVEISNEKPIKETYYYSLYYVNDILTIKVNDVEK